MKKLLTAIILTVATVGSVAARDNEDSRLTIGGYGEATYTRMFYSNNYKRYTNANLYADAAALTPLRCRGQTVGTQHLSHRCIRDCDGDLFWCELSAGRLTLLRLMAQRHPGAADVGKGKRLLNRCRRQRGWRLLHFEWLGD